MIRATASDPYEISRAGVRKLLIFLNFGRRPELHKYCFPSVRHGNCGKLNGKAVHGLHDFTIAPARVGRRVGVVTASRLSVWCMGTVTADGYVIGHQ